MRAPLSAALLVLVLATPASADHCTTYTTSSPEIDTNPTGAEGIPRFYADIYICDGSPDCLFDLYTYEETNGIPGLQRDDPFTDDTCHGSIASDTIFF